MIIIDGRPYNDHIETDHPYRHEWRRDRRRDDRSGTLICRCGDDGLTRIATSGYTVPLGRREWGWHEDTHWRVCLDRED